MLFWFLNRDDDDYQRARDYERQRFWFIPRDIVKLLSGGTVDRHIKIPKPDTLGIAFCTLPELMMDALYHKGDEESRNVAASLLPLMLDAISPIQTPSNWGSLRDWGGTAAATVPPIVGIPMEIFFNFSRFQRRQLYPEWKQGKQEPADWVDPSTTSFAKQTANVWKGMLNAIGGEESYGISAYQNMQVAPVWIDHALNAATGGVMLEPFKAFDAISSIMEGYDGESGKDRKRKPLDASDLPGVGWAFQRPESNQIVDKVYEEGKLLTRKKGSLGERDLELSDEDAEKLTALQAAQKRFKKIRAEKVATLAERKEKAREMNTIAAEALGWKLRSEKAEERKNRFLRGN